MRAFFLVSLSTVVLSGCLTTQSNPNYEQSTSYRNATPATQQYATAPVSQVTQATSYSQDAYTQQAYSNETYSSDAYSNNVTNAGYASTTTYPAYAHPAPAPVYESPATYELAATAPTDTAYGTEEITGTPGFMAMQAQNGPVTSSASVSSLSSVQTASNASVYGSSASYSGAGTPVDYDYSRNLITADALTTGQQPDETVRIMQGTGQNYTVQPGDTVYSLSRKTCVGVNVIQSMNGIGGDYAIKIGQSLTLPSSVC